MAIKVAPSLLAADPLHFAAAAASMEASGADLHHIDVMDGHFVPNLSFGLPLIQALKKVAKIPLDVHIMVSNPDQVAHQYIDAGANYLVFHAEASYHPYRLAQAIRASGAKAGIAINPGTPLEALWPLLEVIDLVNVMSVNPGFGGQAFIPAAIARVGIIAARIAAMGLKDIVEIEVDGGINQETGRLVVAAGATILVAGTHIFTAHNRAEAISELQSIRG